MSKIKKQLSVVIPFYNEEKTLPRLITRVLRQREVFEVIVVDDGSTDNSVETIKPFLRNGVKLVRHKTNKGKGTALVSGLKKARGKWVIFQDADLELDPRDYKVMIKPLVDGQADFVIGNRWKNKVGFFWPQLGNRFLTGMVNVLFDTRVSDSYCGYKAASRKLWESLELTSPRFEIEAEIIAKVGIRKVKISEVDVDYKPRTYKEGKKIKARDVIRGLRTLLHLRITNW